jgi:Kae1-associated kinase Bud32
VTNKIIYKGAEAEIRISEFLNRVVVEKKRISKSYRIKEIDNNLITSRTKEEAKLISEARKSGVCVPIIFDVNVPKGILVMQYIQGDRIKDIINDIDENERRKLCILIGESIAQLHNNGIIHGDLTTSNMIFYQEKIYFIDFGLGIKSEEVESQGVDLHVLMEAFESTHSQFPKCFSYVMQGYSNKYRLNVKSVVQKINDIVKRGRYR